MFCRRMYLLSDVSAATSCNRLLFHHSASEHVETRAAASSGCDSHGTVAAQELTPMNWISWTTWKWNGSEMEVKWKSHGSHWMDPRWWKSTEWSHGSHGFTTWGFLWHSASALPGGTLVLPPMPMKPPNFLPVRSLGQGFCGSCDENALSWCFSWAT